MPCVPRSKGRPTCVSLPVRVRIPVAVPMTALLIAALLAPAAADASRPRTTSTPSPARSPRCGAPRACRCASRRSSRRRPRWRHPGAGLADHTHVRAGQRAGRHLGPGAERDRQPGHRRRAAERDSIAVDPNNPMSRCRRQRLRGTRSVVRPRRHPVQRPRRRLLGTYFSNDGGQTWCCSSTTGTPGHPHPGRDPAYRWPVRRWWRSRSCVGSQGNVYYAGLGFNRASAPNQSR